MLNREPGHLDSSCKISKQYFKCSNAIIHTNSGLVPRPLPRFQWYMLKKWEWPGDKATLIVFNDVERYFLKLFISY